MWPGYKLRYNTANRAIFYTPDHSAERKDIIAHRRAVVEWNTGTPHLDLASATKYQPRYNIGSHRPQYDRFVWILDGYTPLCASPALGDAQQTHGHLLVSHVDLHVEENRMSHHTENYENGRAIFRRGQPFKVTVSFDEAFNPESDSIVFQFSTGETPQESRRTLVRMSDTEEPDIGGWSVVLEQLHAGNTKATYQIRPPSDCIVGRYVLFIETHKRSSVSYESFHKHRVGKILTLLFNPWCEEDTVYLASEAERTEYVLSDNGRIFTGTSDRIDSRPWYYGQMEKVCLEAALFLLERSPLGRDSQNDATLVAREMAVMSNSCNGTAGVLTGNWSGKYYDGRSPSSWNSSVPILAKYMCLLDDVKFGQCWVFAGLVTTLCRALGIPCRCVTNYNSAHDQDYSTTINSHVTNEGRPLVHLDDTVWDFHVWNEVWMRRPDLPDGYDGWQALDATTHENGNDRLSCGPSPVAAVKEGQLYIGSNTKYTFAQVHGDCVTWIVGTEGNLKALSVVRRAVGTLICTKEVASLACKDITHQYKPPTGSEEERAVEERAARFSSRQPLRAQLHQASQDDVKFTFSADVDKKGDIRLALSCRNVSQEERNCHVTVFANERFYTGVCGRELGHKSADLSLAPAADEEMTWTETASSYLNYRDEDTTVCVTIMARVQQTQQIFVDKRRLNIEKPTIQLAADPTTVEAGKTFQLKVTLFNPLDVAIHGGELYVQAPGMEVDWRITVNRSIRAGETVTEKVEILMGDWRGKREVIVCFRSDRVVGVTGALEIEVL